MTTGEWIRFIALWILGTMPIIIGLNLGKVERALRRFWVWLVK